jgi:hypothetical protein
MYLDNTQMTTRALVLPKIIVIILICLLCRETGLQCLRRAKKIHLSILDKAIHLRLMEFRVIMH